MKHIFMLLTLLWTSWLWAQGSSGIPTKYMNDPAVDLVRNGKLLLPDEVHELRESMKGRFDISTLNPTDTSDLWKDVYVKTLPADKNPLIDMDEVVYNSPVASETGIFRFNVQNKAEDGKLYTMMISSQIHTLLMAKSLLRKIGYQIPDIKYIPRIVVKFKDETEKKLFTSYLKDVAWAGDVKSWVIEDLAEDKLLVQDLLVMDSTHPIYNLAVGVTADMIQGRRLLSSLVVPLTIVNLEESVNMLRWNAGIEDNKEIKLFHNRADEFQASWDDARWITRRIEKLTREDWKEIVVSSHTPKAVQMILLEKIISRRNSVMKLFKIDAENFKVDSDLTSGVELVKGKLTQQNWPGYGSRFAHGDPDSPLSDSDFKSFLKSKAISTGIELAMAQINQLPFMGTDIKAMNDAKYKKVVEDAIKSAQGTGKPAELPVKSWVFPTIRGQLILSRNLVTGTYMGTDNLVQLVDTVGVAIGGGVFGAVVGLPVQVSGGAEAQLVRTYAHIRPVRSIEQSLKYPFKNIFVPLVKKDYGELLHQATQVVISETASEKDKEAALAKALKPFKDTLAQGESLLVTDNIAAGTQAKIGAGYKQLVRASLGLQAGYTVVSRFHVHRKSEHEFQIYRDIGNVGSYGISFGLTSLVPVLNVQMKSSKGAAKVKFFSLDLNPANPQVLEHASLLRKAIVSSSTKTLDEKEETKPFILRHNFKEKTPSLNFLFWQWQKVNSFTDIEIQSPAGEKRFYKRSYYGTTNGKNYQAYAADMISHWVNLLFEKQAGLSSGTGNNPGYSYKGRAKTKFLTLDQEVTEDGALIEPFIRINKVYNGWSIDRKRAQEILDEMTNKYRFEFYNAPVLNDTRDIFMYNISLNVLLYKEGISNIVKLTEAEIKEIFKKHFSYKDLTINPANYKENDTKVERFIRHLEKFKRYEEKEDEAKANKYLLKALYLAEDQLTLAGLSALAGGAENLYASATIGGFREGDEDGDRSIVSNSLGEFGSERQLGPIIDMQRKTRMLEGEFFIYWLMTRLI